MFTKYCRYCLMSTIVIIMHGESVKVGISTYNLVYIDTHRVNTAPIITHDYSLSQFEEVSAGISPSFYNFIVVDKQFHYNGFTIAKPELESCLFRTPSMACRLISNPLIGRFEHTKDINFGPV